MPGGPVIDSRLKLFVIDFDGTALGGYEPYARFPDGLCRFLDEIADAGAQWATCTTWHPFVQNRAIEDGGVRSRPVRLLGRTGLNCGLYADGRVCLDAAWDLEMLQQHAEFYREHVPAIRAFLNGCEACRSLVEHFDFIFAVGLGDSSREEMILILHRSPVVRAHTYLQFNADGTEVQIVPAHMSKGIAVRKLQGLLGVGPEHTMVAGDGENDLPMLGRDVTAMPVAPANASATVRAFVLRNGGAVGDSPYSDGVVEAARRLLQGAP